MGQEEPASAGSAIRILSGQPLLAHAIKLLVEDTCPGLAVDVEIVPPLNGMAMRLELAGGDRWMAMLGSRASAEDVLDVLREGAWCLVSADSTPKEFAIALEALLRGTDPGIPVAVARQLFVAGSSVEVEHLEDAHLTPREREVLRLVAEGHTNGAIAARLSISIHTVRTHLSSMMTKLDARSRVELIRAAVSRGYDEARFRGSGGERS